MLSLSLSLSNRVSPGCGIRNLRATIRFPFPKKRVWQRSSIRVIRVTDMDGTSPFLDGVVVVFETTLPPLSRLPVIFFLN